MNELIIPDIQLTDNTSQRLACVLVLDGSASMHGERIDELNAGLKIFEEELKKDDTAAQRVQVLVIRLGDDDDIEIVNDWVDALEFSAPKIKANGRTPLGKAMVCALEKIEEQKANYKAHDIPYNRPWILAITDGGPTDYDWEEAAEECRQAEIDKKVVIFTIGVGVDPEMMPTLKKFSTRSPLTLKGLQFKELFIWLSQSVASASTAALDTETQLPTVDWGTVPS